ncbi:dGTPase [Arcanobacterium wilhelmae]|uniref:DGTPase n=1 Tax=Arcanobacterium wilhelmae TaxID=1803177 RepID=A0ABT9N941_9ACTO|nr:deoxyguanosinetriphosphate triphosphohydrolase [Arcanobacterium wilhelmae]MDP9800224.1 dGTPase [Arcanobacterium wilhelmae]WFN89663.1 deoxyguanosinetriphosphate triphosphohydrolase [Arcanobacterium wilhelmae]
MNYSSEDLARFVPEAAKSPWRSDFERDRARLIHSSALRRLGAKTQVLGPEADDFIRTRLTHSLEVAQVGRSFAKNFGADPDVVETACLAHDLGHPPFGHNGEQVLDVVASEIGGFEGNAQTLRILTRLEPKRFDDAGAPAGLNLTRAVLDATVKYPWKRHEGPAGQASPKFGAYADDVPVFEWAHGGHGNVKSAEAQMMDLSDDIAYSVHDLEDTIVRRAMVPQDFVAKGAAELDAVVESTLAWYGTKISAGELTAAAQRLFALKSWPSAFNDTLRDLAQLKDLTSDLIGRFVSAVTDATRAEIGYMPLIRYAGNVVVPRETLAEIYFLKGIAVHYVMAPREHEPIFFEQRTMLFDLVDAFSEDPARLERPFFDAYQRAEDDAERLRVVIDQVASLTDQSARAYHASLVGFLRN